MYDAIAGYGLGGSSIALFGRVGGGIYTKAAEGLICPAKTTMAWKKMITGTPLALLTTSVTTSVISLACVQMIIGDDLVSLPVPAKSAGAYISSGAVKFR